MKELFPEPETPVIEVITPNGTSTFIFFILKIFPPAIRKSAFCFSTFFRNFYSSFTAQVTQSARINVFFPVFFFAVNKSSKNPATITSLHALGFGPDINNII